MTCMKNGPADKVTIFCDGACSPNPGKGGWAALLKYKGHKKEISGNERYTTNNRMELTAAVKALSRLKYPCAVTVYTDSKYLSDCFRQGWIEKWIQKGWKTASKKPVKNQDLWKKLHSLSRKHTITWKWVEGHAGHPENEYVDKLAVRERSKLT